MTLKKAIEELNRVDDRVDIICYPEFKEAVNLGIEALKEIQRARVVSILPEIHQLPGETKE